MLGVRGYHGVAGIARGTPCKGEISLCAGMHYADAMNETSRPLDERLVILAEIGAAHGIAGEVRIRSHTADPLAFGRYGPLSGSDGRSYRVLSMRPSRGVVIARLEGIDSRDAAERLKGVTLAVPRSALPPEEDDEEFYHADLIGLSVHDHAGRDWGRVIAVHDFGAGNMLEIRGADGRSHMVPFSRAAVPVVDPRAGRILVDPVAAGLVEES